MDFHELMHVAATKQHEAMKKKTVNRYSLDLPPPKREEKRKPSSETVQKFILEREREKQAKERERQEKEQKEREDRERKEREERKRNQFRIPKKKAEPEALEKQQLIDSLFDDSDGDSSSETTDAASKSQSISSSSSSSKQSSSITKDLSSRAKDSSSDHSHRTSSSDSKKSHSGSDKLSSSSHRHNGHPSSSSSSSSSSKHAHKHSSSSSKHRKEDSSSSSLSKQGKTLASKHLENQNRSVPKKDKVSSSGSSNDSKKNSDPKNPIALNKNHLTPIQERHVENSQLSEKAKILARLQAIKERTLAAIAKENEAKGKRVKGVKTQRKSKTEEMNDKAKSSELVKDTVSSDEEGGNGQDMPSALDIMLSERNAKLEKERIARLAKQAWERATKGDAGHSEKESKKHNEKKVRKSSEKSVHKEKKDKVREGEKNEGRISPAQEASVSRQEPPRPKKPVIVRHAGNSAPPPMDFKAIMAIAEQKSKEPPKPAGPLKIPKKKKDEERRPMTQEEKDRMERRKTKEYQDWLKFGGKAPTDHTKHSISDEEKEQDVEPAKGSKPSSKPTGSNHTNFNSNSSSSSTSGTQKAAVSSNHHHHHHRRTEKNSSSGNHHRNIPVNENLLVCGPHKDGSEEEDVGAQSNPFDRIMKQVHKKRPASEQPVKPSKRLRIDSEEEEEDSDMDDFIDDGDEGELDYSKEIQKMFGYDKSRYKHEREDDLSNMEASFSTVMAEEKRSAKLGKMEDLEDMRREEEELRQKAALKKQKFRRNK
ncbi:protein spt2 homolog [Plakobranchus ocellatus]|uniref:Protein spt2 homolog n=1 Tax=Plakobranchus ocellatus TaxID=259542 RepID=A0AAV3Y070_9GAST|nr:protein spt2 homolog [Plakobranchus ocellatus]